MRERITITEQSIVYDASGGASESTTTVATVNGYVEKGLKDYRRKLDQNTQIQSEYKFYIRPLEDYTITSSNYIEWRGDTYNITELPKQTLYDRFIVISAAIAQ